MLITNVPIPLKQTFLLDYLILICFVMKDDISDSIKNLKVAKILYK